MVFAKSDIGKIRENCRHCLQRKEIDKLNICI